MQGRLQDIALNKHDVVMCIWTDQRYLVAEFKPATIAQFRAKLPGVDQPTMVCHTSDFVRIN